MVSLYGQSHLHDIERDAYIWKVCGIYLDKILNSEKLSGVSLLAQKKTVPM